MSYVIAGRAIKNEYLALGTYALTGLGAFLATRGGDKKETVASKLPAAASTGNSDEESFIKDFVNKMQEEAGKVKEAVKH